MQENDAKLQKEREQLYQSNHNQKPDEPIQGFFFNNYFIRN